jgi:phosphinothricin acetyltransferase
MAANGDQAPDGLQVRIAQPDDAAALAAIYAPYVTDTAITFEIEPPDAAEMAWRMSKVLARLPWLVAERDGAVLGYAYASAHRDRAAYQWSVDVAIYVDRTAHRKGVGRVLYAPLLAVLRRQGFHQAYAGITLPNPASVGLHEAMGFTPVGVYREVGYKAGAWRDVGWWGLVLGPAPADPAVPRPFEAGVLD